MPGIPLARCCITRSQLDQQRAAAGVSLDGDKREPGGAKGSGLNLPDPSPDPEANLSRLESESRLKDVLAALPIEQRECLVLCELEQLTYKEIARVTEVPIGTVMSRLWRARTALMKYAS
jgi:RNA polymerase sigma factor (sigma-70 family)